MTKEVTYKSWESTDCTAVTPGEIIIKIGDLAEN